MSMRAISRGDKDQNGTERFGTSRNSERGSANVGSHKRARKKESSSGKEREIFEAEKARASERDTGTGCGERFKRCSTAQAWATRDHHDKSSGQTSIQFISL